MNFISSFYEGGWVMYPLFLVSIFNFSIVIYSTISILQLYLNFPKFLPEHQSKIEHSIFRIESKITWLSNLSSIATLLGLLGTVIGIYDAFGEMKLRGEASPEIFAAGINKALITTIYGLSIAIPSVLFYHLLKYFLERFEFKVYLKVKKE